ncbi:SWIM zinc finger family protein [Brevibacillus laterosporus]|uniref:SWIM zinc finger family protein n=1 Tax=Brevibacillus laterosporus TaxID=1465 RepID=UPI00264CEE00|nr:SWIM zinc finger family protein [Brevibacillus laterosporus]MDN9009652.1 SWIM zinc finger family protein [Brevibacillus laterosporus]MDO0940349.1 SWIM zinc finger family protein [Brevibacillus laterosporus]
MKPQKSNVQIEWVARLKELIRKAGGAQRNQRGRTKAKEGGVLEWSAFDAGIKAKVTGANQVHYTVSLSPKKPIHAGRDKALHIIRQSPLFTAQLLGGTFSEELAAHLADLKIEVLPDSLEEWNAHCSCPDVAGYCKHVYALYYQLLAEAEEDPFVFLAFLGLHRAEIIGGFREQWLPHSKAFTGEGMVQQDNSRPTEPINPSELLKTGIDEEVGAVFLRRAVDHGTFFQTAPHFSAMTISFTQENILPEQLLLIWGPPAFAVRKEAMMIGALQEVYRVVSKKAGEEIAALP